MTRFRESASLPEPPWTQAPSEVLAWGAATGNRREARVRPHPATRVKSYAAHLPVAEEARLLGHLARLRIGHVRDGRVHLPHLVTRLGHHAPSESFVGRVGGMRIEVRVRKKNRIEVHVRFVPKTTFRRAWRIVTRMGLHPNEGTWA